MILRVALAACMAGAVAAPALAVAPTGGFFVHLNQQNVSSFSDSRRSVTFYDADDINSGSASPLFSVHIPGEFIDPGQYNGEEVDAIAADPTTGDVYVLSFDSGTAGNVVSGGAGAPVDTEGDFDLYKINFATIYDHWSNNFQGTTVTNGVTAGVGGVAPTVPAGAPAGGFDDYITYSSLTQTGAGLHFDDVNRAHSNTFTLAGAVEKIGEVKRNGYAGASNFYDFSLEFVDADTLVVLDDSSAPTSTDTQATDHEYRLLERVSTAPGAANDASGDFLDGGYNSGTTESWNSTRIGTVSLDFAGGAPIGHSEPESIAYHEDTLSGVRGFWVTENDSSAATRGDTISFFDIDTQSYREFAVGGGPTFPTTFELDDDPFVNSSLNDGQADHIFVDSDTGDLIIVESGFGDAGIATIGADHEPSVIRREVLSYDDGAGRIQFGAWGQKIITTPTKDTGDTFLERGHWAAYDSENDLVYFYNPSGGGETPAFQNDIMVLDVNTGVTTTLNNVDDSVSLFFGDSFGDVADFFTIAAAPTFNDADFNKDGQVNLADLNILGANFGTMGGATMADGDANMDGNVDLGDLNVLGANFGFGVPAVAVPEPTTAVLALAGVVALGLRRRNG